MIYLGYFLVPMTKRFVFGIGNLEVVLPFSQDTTTMYPLVDRIELTR